MAPTRIKPGLNRKERGKTEREKKRDCSTTFESGPYTYVSDVQTSICTFDTSMCYYILSSHHRHHFNYYHQCHHHFKPTALLCVTLDLHQ